MRYVFSEIPANEEGELLLSLMKKYLNKKNYKLRARGQYLKEGNDWRKYTRGQPISKSKCIRVYIDRK